MKKLFIIAIMLITSFSASFFAEKKNDNTDNETIIQEEKYAEENTEVVVDNTEMENAKNEVEQEEIKENSTNKITEQITKSEDTKKIATSTSPKNNSTQTVQKNNSEITTNNSKNSNSQDTSKTSSSQSSQTTASASNNNGSSQSNNNATKETNTPKEITPNDMEYWCVGGGKHHVAGDGANEHGYYSSWDDAYTAFESYTSSWASVQFKVSRCSCGLYYFWAIQ